MNWKEIEVIWFYYWPRAKQSESGIEDGFLNQGFQMSTAVLVSCYWASRPLTTEGVSY